HTLLVAMEDHGKFRVLGQTVDDAAGEAFDKVARFLGLGYPGGPAIDRLPAPGGPPGPPLPPPHPDGRGALPLFPPQTAAPRWVRAHPEAPVADIAASFQAAVVEVCATKLLRAAERTGINTVVIGGGVAANRGLRAAVAAGAAAAGLQAVVPSPELCTDNAAM